MSSIDRIEKLTGQYEKEMELAEKHRNRGKEHMELAEKHTKKAGDLEKQIKYEKGGEVFDRVNALNLTPEELQLILQLLDDRTQLMDAVRKMFPERIQNNGGNIADAGNDPDKGEDPDTRVPEQDRDSDKPFSPYSDPGESPAYGENGADGEDEEFPVYGEDDDEDDGKGEETWSA